MGVPDLFCRSLFIRRYFSCLNTTSENPAMFHIRSSDQSGEEETVTFQSFGRLIISVIGIGEF